MIDDLLGGLGHNADAAGILNDATGEGQIGAHRHLGSAVAFMQLEANIGMGRPASTIFPALGAHRHLPRGGVDMGDLRGTLEGQGDRPKAQAHRAFIAVIIDHLGQLGAGQTRRDIGDVEQ